jgi:hypothetical protein
VDPTILGMGPKKRVLESGLLIIINISVFIAVLRKCQKGISKEISNFITFTLNLMMTSSCKDY